MGAFRTRRVGELAPGDGMLVGHERSVYVGGKYRRQVDTRRVTVAEVGRGMVRCVGSDGTPFDVPMGIDGVADWRVDCQIHWTAPLPVGDAAAAKTYCDALVAHGRDAILLHVTSVSDGRFGAALVQHAADDEPGGTWLTAVDPEEVGRGGERHGNADFWDAEVTATVIPDAPPLFLSGPAAVAPVPVPEVGDLVVAGSFDCVVEDGAILTRLRSAAVVGRFADRAAVGAFLPPRRAEGRPYDPPAGGTATSWDHLEAQEVARARLEPNEGLVLWYDQGDGSGRSCAFLSTSGIAFHRVDAIEDMFHGTDLEPGLYLYSNATWHPYESHEGERDVDIEGDWSAATPEDCARHGFTDLADLDAEIAGHMEEAPEDPLGHTATRYMALAAAALEAEAASRAAPGP